MFATEVKYARMVGLQLPRYKIKKDTGHNFMSNFRCPICGDSTTSKRKARGYIYSHGDKLFMKCFNCEASMTFGHFLKDVDYNLYKQYALEAFKENHEEKVTFAPSLGNFYEVETENTTLFKNIKRLTDLPLSHPARQYATNRLIPAHILEELYYAPKFFKWSLEHSDKFSSLTNLEDIDHPRLIIPFYDEEGTVFKYHARAFGKETPKYISITINEHPEGVYGLNRVDWNKPVFVVEGPIDSMFLPNAIAIGSSALNTFDKWGADLIYLFDQQPRNRDIVKLINKTINSGKKVVLVDEEEFVYKDINEAVMAGETTESLTYLFGKHTYQGLAAKMKFNTWRKI